MVREKLGVWVKRRVGGTGRAQTLRLYKDSLHWASGCPLPFSCKRSTLNGESPVRELYTKNFLQPPLISNCSLPETVCSIQIEMQRCRRVTANTSSALLCGQTRIKHQECGKNRQACFAPTELRARQVEFRSLLVLTKSSSCLLP